MEVKPRLNLMKQENSRGTTAQQNDSEAISKSQRLRSRRLIVRGVAAAVPTILSLHSGTALARSSNLIRTAMDLPETLDSAKGKVYTCLDEKSVESLGDNLYDLGEPANARFTSIRADHNYYDGNGNKVTPDFMCKNGGTYYTDAPGTRIDGKAPAQADLHGQSFIPTADRGERVKVAQGGLVSATALTSIMSRANITISEI
jgi:hypothetical protein